MWAVSYTHLDINRKGGVNLFAPIVVYMIVGFIQTMLIYLL